MWPRALQFLSHTLTHSGCSNVEGKWVEVAKPVFTGDSCRIVILFMLNKDVVDTFCTGSIQTGKRSWRRVECCILVFGFCSCFYFQKNWGRGSLLWCWIIWQQVRKSCTSGDLKRLCQLKKDFVQILKYWFRSQRCRFPSDQVIVYYSLPDVQPGEAVSYSTR